MKLITRIVISLLAMSLLSCSNHRPSHLGVTNSRLATCPTSPNCVSSDASDAGHQIPPLQLHAPADRVWQMSEEAVSALPRTHIVTTTPDYLHAECRSALFGFVDDLELHLRPNEGIIAVRSASRLGYSDFGVNRRRIETLRKLLIHQGMVR